MPTVNVFYQESSEIGALEKLIPKLKEYLADKLTCGDIKLTPEEISIRLIRINGGEMIGDVELEITAHAFSERVKRQDEICLEVADYLKEKLPSLGEIKVWLKLSELGHSWK